MALGQEASNFRVGSSPRHEQANPGARGKIARHGAQALERKAMRPICFQSLRANFCRAYGAEGNLLFSQGLTVVIAQIIFSGRSRVRDVHGDVECAVRRRRANGTVDTSKVGGRDGRISFCDINVRSSK
jgi:hypothetical protein